MTNTVVKRVLFENDKAMGDELTDGPRLAASREVIVSAGALRTAQLLMLSGTGPRSELSKHSIKQIFDMPIGQYLHDHGSVNLVWKLKNPQNGYAFGSSAFNKPEYATGNPRDWFATGAVPNQDLREAAKVDETTFEPRPRIDYVIKVMYAITAAAPVEMAPMDGTHITTGVLCLSPSSRGTVTLASIKATKNPIIDPRNFSTEHDRAVIRAGLRRTLQAMESTVLKDHIEGETTPPGMPRISSSSSDAELDGRLDAMSWSWYHTAGTASMRKVVDTQCLVYGVKGLRVVDTSIIPLSITAHLQAPMYAIAESAADIIAQRDSAFAT